MAKCKICKKNIPDGTEFCSDCQDKKSSVANESYLDSLLNSVKNTMPANDNVYKKRTNSEPDRNTSANKKSNNTKQDNHPIPDPDLNDYMSYKVDLGDITDFDQYFMEDDLKDIQGENEISAEKLFGKDINALFSDDPKAEQERQSDKKPADQKGLDESQNAGFVDETIGSASSEYEDSIENASTEYEDAEDNIIPIEEEVQPKELLFQEDGPSHTTSEDTLSEEEVYYSDEDQAEQIEEEDIPEDSTENSFSPVEMTELETEDDYDSDLNDLLNSLDTVQTSEQETSEPDEYEPKPAAEMEFEPADDDKFEQIEQEEDDFLALLNQISSDDPVAGDVKAINDLLSGSAPKNQKKTDMPSDVGEVFSDALKVVSSLNDIDEQSILDKIPDTADKKDKKKKAKKEPKGKKKKNKKDAASEGASEKPKKSLFKRLFGNIKDENAPASNKNNKSDKPLSESEPAKDTGKKAKGKKPKKGTQAPGLEEGEESGKGGKGKAAKAAEKTQKKAEKKEKKKKTKEIIQVIDEIDEDEGRINRLGAAIVFIFFGLLTALLLVGTNMVSYSLSIQNATNYFERKKYTEAYNEVYGMDINDEDIEVYDKIMTVMFVNKQLNSYNNYYSLSMYPEALDALLKGLKRYDKYIELATMLGIDTDLNYVRNQILAELKNEFGLSEKEAIQINSYQDMKEYSKEVYNVVLENMSH